MIRTTATVNTKPLDDFAAYLDNFNEIVGGIAQETYDGFAEPIRRRLSEEPGPVKYPVQWTTEKQRRAYFASNGFGNGIPYQRTGRLSQAWEVILVEDPGTFKIQIFNTAPQAKYVYGALGATSRLIKQPMHTNTGWLDAKPIIDIYLEGMMNFFVRRMQEELTDFGRVTGSGRRAYTGGS